MRRRMQCGGISWLVGLIVGLLLSAQPGECSSSPDISNDRLLMSVHAIQASHIAYNRTLARAVYGATNVFVPEGQENVVQHLALIQETGARCVVAYASSTRKNDEDINGGMDDVVDFYKDSANLEPHNVCSRTDSLNCCKTHRGLEKAYKETRVDVERRMNSCVQQNKKLVFTGHGLGGAVALVAALRYEAYGPAVYTFGQPPAFSSGACPHIPDVKLLRWINTVNLQPSPPNDSSSSNIVDRDVPAPRLLYDAAPFLTTLLASSSPSVAEVQQGSVAIFPADLDDDAAISLLAYYPSSVLVPQPTLDQLDGAPGNQAPATSSHAPLQYMRKTAAVFAKSQSLQGQDKRSAPLAVCNDVSFPATSNCQLPSLDQTALEAIAGQSSTDGDGNATLVFKTTSEGPFDVGQHEVTVTVGNGQDVSSCSATITIVDEIRLTSDDIDCGEVDYFPSCDLPEILLFDQFLMKSNGCRARVSNVTLSKCESYDPYMPGLGIDTSCDGIEIRPDFSVVVGADSISPNGNLEFLVTMDDFVTDRQANRTCSVCLDAEGCRRRRHHHHNRRMMRHDQRVSRVLDTGAPKLPLSCSV